MVKVTIEANGEKNVFEGDFVYGIVGTEDEGKGCQMANVLIGEIPSIDMPQYLAEAAVNVIKVLPLCKENTIVKHGMLAEFAGRARDLVEKAMAREADAIGEGIIKYFKSLGKEV